MKSLFIILLLSYPVFSSAQKSKSPSQKNVEFQSKVSITERSTAQLYKEALPSVVTIFTSANVPTDNGLKSGGGLGSGVLVSPSCHILTAAHVVARSTKILVKTQDGQMRSASVLFSEPNADIALLKLDTPDDSLSHAKLGNSQGLAVGQNVYAIGSPYGMENSFSSGVVSALRSFDEIYNGTVKVDFIQTDAAINSGNSGGPLFNSQGEVIGIASSILTVSGGFQGIGMAVSIDTAKDLLEFEERPWIGVNGILIEKEEFEQIFNLPLQGGMLIQSVAKGSPAEKAGLRPGYIKAVINGRDIILGGDIILSIEDHKTCHMDCFFETKPMFKDKTNLTISYLRQGKEYTTTVDVSESRKNFLTFN
ncbi:S1C family serine protease [uncultured Croceitalea sp.]|uniref:S1C family serine protease n=1 Tax=uncultured Croceitalea sp. TaxID=1798908 RepID=UPI00374E283A